MNLAPETRVAELEVKYLTLTPTLTFAKFPTRNHFQNFATPTP